MKIEIDKKELWKTKDELTKRKTYSTRMQFGFDEGVKFALEQVNKLLISGVVVPKGTCCLNPSRISHVTVDGKTNSTCENCKEEIV